MNTLADIENDVLLCMAPPFAPSMPPIGIGYINAFLKSKNIKSKILDINISLYNSLSSDQQSLWQIDISGSWSNIDTIDKLCPPAAREIIVDDILSNKPKVIGFSVNSANKLFTLLLIDAIRKRKIDVFIVLGGPGCYYQEDRDFFPKGSVDAFVVGEGEISFYELFSALDNKIKIDSIPGILFPDSLHTYKARPLVDNLDLLPYPDISDFDISSYSAKSLPVMFSRGCVNKCAFCSDHLVWDGKYRTRSAESVLNEIKSNFIKTGIKDIIFYDLTINGNISVLENFCDVLIKEGSDFRFTANICVRKQMNATLLNKMKTSGFFALYWGVESGSDRILKAMKKNFNSADAMQNLKDAKNVGILNYINLIVGFPGETESDFMDTLEFFKKNSTYIEGVNNVNQCHLVANTHIFRHHETYNIQEHTTPDWYENDNTRLIREKNKKILIDTIKAYGKKLFSDGKLTVTDDQKEKGVFSVKTCDALVILAPFFSISEPNRETADLLGRLSQQQVHYILYDLNMKIYQNSSEKNRTLWQQHNITKWTSDESFTNILDALKLDDLRSYFDHINANIFLLPLTVFNFCFVKKLTDFLSENYPNKKIIWVDICQFYEFQNIDCDKNVTLLKVKSIDQIFSKALISQHSKPLLNYLDFSLDLYEKNIISFPDNSVILDDDLKKHTINKIPLFDKLLEDNVDIPSGFKWGACVTELNNVDELLELSPSFVKVKVAPDSMSKKSIDSSFFSLSEIETLIMKCDAFNTELYLDIVVGLPGETKEDFQDFCRFLKKHLDSFSAFSNVDKFIPNLDFLNSQDCLDLYFPDEEKFPLLWIDDQGSNDYLRTLRVYMILKILKENGKTYCDSNINFFIPHSTDNKLWAVAESIGEILEYKNQEVMDLNNEKKILAQEINKSADIKVAKMVKDKDDAISRMAKKHENDFSEWEDRFIAEVSKRDQDIKSLYIQNDELNTLINGLEDDNRRMKNSLGFKLEKLFRKIFFLRDK